MANYKQVSYGSQGSDVTELQKLLNQNGYKLSEDGIFGSKTQAAVKDYQTKNNLAVDGIVGTNTWGALTKAQSSSGSTTNTATQEEPKTPTFDYDANNPSDTVKQAYDMLQQHIANKPGEWQGGTWYDTLNETINQILNREKFSYDLNGDALYQQYKDQYTTQGKLASMDVMGQTAAMTGGYGNSYAQAAGQQAYQGYLQQLNDKVPELYQLALNQYNAEGEAMRGNAELMAKMDEQEYGRYRDTIDDYYTELDYLADDARYKGEQDYNQAMDAFNIAYGQHRDNISDTQWQTEFDEAVRQYDQQYALSTSGSSSSGSGGSGGGGGGGSYTANPGWDKETIKAFQKEKGLTVDGIWGPKTAAAYDKDSDWTPAPKGLNDYDNATHEQNVADNGGSYYKNTLDVLKTMKKAGKSNAEVSQMLQELVGNSYLTSSEYMTLYQKYRNNQLG